MESNGSSMSSAFGSLYTGGCTGARAKECNVELISTDAGIGLLIGMNAPKVLEPWRIKNSKGRGLYTVKTFLRWVIKGEFWDKNYNLIYHLS